MRSFTIVLILAICAPAVLCQNDDDSLFDYFFWMPPRTSATRESISNPESDITSIDAVEPNQDEVEILPSDVYYNRDQSAPVQFETESTYDTTAMSTTEEMASESGKKSTDTSSSEGASAQQALVDSEFWKHFMAILTKMEKEQPSTIENPPNKAELNKFTGKKYNPIDAKKSRQIGYKAENPTDSVADTVNFGFESTASSSSHSQSSTFTTDQSSSEKSDESSEESSYGDDDGSESRSTNSNYQSQTSGIYFDSDRIFVPLAPFPDDYEPISYIVEESDEKMPEIEDTLPRTSASTISIPSITSCETVDTESTKEENARESTISESSTDDSTVSNGPTDDGENQRIAEIQSSMTSNTKEENFEIISSNDETVDAVSTNTENVESTKEDKAESTEDKNENEIENDIPIDDDKPLGHISFGQFMKALIKRMVL
ncbi:uncharacterized protein LOC116349072 [Contarinia nasturtii]|uniref:uncharacterized protein LOC116349072 n=1 Tax=Contarinia nasturtii TaxID=265458 RepID=UPI0012D37E8F|nr:uncharacterized protein LOC116349072 [Contarinia nasturtii]